MGCVRTQGIWTQVIWNINFYLGRTFSILVDSVSKEKKRKKNAWERQWCQKSHTSDPFYKVLLRGKKSFVQQDHRRVSYLFSLVGVGCLKVLQHGRKGRSSFTNNEPSCPSDVAAVHSLSRSDPHRTRLFSMYVFACVAKHKDKPNVYLYVNVFPSPRTQN